jgi:hypothetical protein
MPVYRPIRLSMLGKVIFAGIRGLSQDEFAEVDSQEETTEGENGLQSRLPQTLAVGCSMAKI